MERGEQVNAPTYQQCAEAEAALLIEERRPAPIDFLTGDGLTEFDVNEREPLPVERLVPEDARRVERSVRA